MAKTLDEDSEQRWLGFVLALDHSFAAELTFTDGRPIVDVRHLGDLREFPRDWPEYIDFICDNTRFVIEDARTVETNRRLANAVPFVRAKLHASAAYRVNGTNIVSLGFDSRFKVMRSRITGLDAWSSRALDNYEEEHFFTPQGALSGAKMHFKLGSERELILLDNIRLSLAPHFSGTERDDGRTMTMNRFFWLVSEAEEGVQIDDHFQAQNVIRDMLTALSGLPLEYTEHQVSATPWKVSPSGPWLDVFTHRWHRRVPPWQPDKPLRNTDFAVDLLSMDTSSFAAWVGERELASRAVQPWLSLLYHGQDGLPPSSEVTELGIALESYGRMLMGGKSHVKHELAVLRTLEEGRPGTSAICEDLEGWAKVFSQTYNGIKHSNRPLPDPIESFTAARMAKESLMQVLMSRIGVTESLRTQWAERYELERFRRTLQRWVADGTLGGRFG